MTFNRGLFGILFILALTSCGAPNAPAGGADRPEDGLAVALKATPNRGAAPLPVRFESNAVSSAGRELSYTWQLANRTFEGGANRSHTFIREGTFAVRVSVSDGVVTVDDTTTVEVGSSAAGEPGNRSPTVTLEAAPTSGTEDLTVDFSATASDPDGDALSYGWDFGDGSAAQTSPAQRHEYEQEGTYTATVTIADGRGGYSSDSVDIVVNDKSGGGDDGDGGDDGNGGSPLPGAAPDIDDFDVDEDSITAGATVTLSWALAGGQPTTLELTNSVSAETVNLLGRTSLPVTPLQPTTYTLTATNAQGSDVERETVRVGDDEDDGGDDGGGNEDSGSDDGGD